MTARLLERAARQGNAQALYNLAIMRIRGQYYDRNEDQAFVLMSEAAKQNHPEAAANLGWMYWNGVGTEVNKRLGCRWWDNAVIVGNDTAKENLSRLCRDVNLSEPAGGNKADDKDADARPAPEAKIMKKGGNRSRPADKKARRSGS
jgi:TPR repeat protein